MCGRFARKSTQDVLAEWFDLQLEDMPWFEPSYNVAPQRTQPVVRLGRDSLCREMALLRWGLVPFWSKDAKIAYSTINAHAEEVASKPAFREALKRRRCLIPADAFYEWQRLDAKTKRPFAFALASGELAGLWESWRPRKQADAPPLETFTILTTAPNELMEPVHNRMPVIVELKDYDHWLYTSDTARLPIDLLRPYPAERMKAWPVSDRVGNVRNNEPELLEILS
jgi:putative SOS response-associated peptidase YedK